MILLLLFCQLSIECENAEQTGYIQDVYDRAMEIVMNETGWSSKDHNITICWHKGEMASYRYRYIPFLGKLISQRILLPLRWNREMLLHEISHSLVVAWLGINSFPDERMEEVVVIGLTLWLMAKYNQLGEEEKEAMAK